MDNLIKRHLTKILGHDKVFLSITEAHDKFQIPKQTIYGWIYTKVAQSAKRVNGHWRILEDEVERLKK